MAEIFIASDHRGYELKNRLVAALSGGTSIDNQISAIAPDGSEYLVSDLGPFELDPNDDYNDAAIAVARAVEEHPDSRGIIVCGSGNGVSIQANRFKGVRAIAPTLPEIARLGREHNDANVLCLSADFLDYNEVANLSNIFLNTKFSGEERHVRRNHRLDEEEGV